MLPAAHCYATPAVIPAAYAICYCRATLRQMLISPLLPATRHIRCRHLQHNVSPTSLCRLLAASHHARYARVAFRHADMRDAATFITPRLSALLMLIAPALLARFSLRCCYADAAAEIAVTPPMPPCC